MTMLRKPNLGVGYNKHYADVGLALADTAVHRMVEVSQRWDSEDEAATEGRIQNSVRTSHDISKESSFLAALERDLQRPNHTKQTKAALETRIKAQRALVERLMQRVKDMKATAKQSVARMHTSRLLQVVSKFPGTPGHRPHKIAKVTIPKEYAATDTLTAIATVREHIAELHNREGTLYRAYLTREEAKDRAFRDVRRNSQRARFFPCLDYALVRKDNNGRMFQGALEIPPDLFWEAIETHTVAYLEDRIDRMYDKLEAGFDADFISFADRVAEHRQLKTRCDELEKIEGALLRRAYLEGHEVPIRADMDASNLIPLVVDHEAEWEAPESGERIYGNKRKAEATAA